MTNPDAVTPRAPFTAPPKTDVHVQPLGGVCITVWLTDGRPYRVIGERPFRGCALGIEVEKVWTWHLQRPVRIRKTRCGRENSEL